MGGDVGTHRDSLSRLVRSLVIVSLAVDELQ
jgi:hypothetical protein